jgi:hypothetical protein
VRALVTAEELYFIIRGGAWDIGRCVCIMFRTDRSRHR